MKVSKEQMKQEAIERMEKWGIYRQTIKEFAEELLISRSEQGFLYWLNDEEKEMVREFEEEHGYLVYHVIKTNTTFGLFYNLLYVRDDDEEWGIDREDISVGRQLVYVKNDTDNFGEFGTILIRMRFGGLVRVA